MTVVAGVPCTAGTLRDIDAIMAVMAVAFDPAFGEAWTRGQVAATFALPGYRWTLARVDDIAVGFVLARTVASESELMLIGVMPANRGRGIGAALIENWLKTSETDQVFGRFLEVREGNRAIALYRRCGFEIVGIRKGYYSANGLQFDALTMRRTG